MRFAFALCALLASPLSAQEVETLGVGRLFTNDYLGDRSDRWRTGSYVISVLRGAPDDQSFRELRLQSQIISPDGRADDRPYAGVVSTGVARHMMEGPVHYVLGVDLVTVGPQTGLAEFQEAFHDRFGMPDPFTQNPLPNATHLRFRASATVTNQISETVSVRPFVAGQAGVEDVFRVGADFVFGPVGQSDIWLRDDVTGQPYRGTDAGQTGVSYTLGADFSRVGNSQFLPDQNGPNPLPERRRARAGVHWQPTADTSFFYGVTYLSEEFAGQSEGQIVGSLTLNFNF